MYFCLHCENMYCRAIARVTWRQVGCWVKVPTFSPLARYEGETKANKDN